MSPTGSPSSPRPSGPPVSPPTPHHADPALEIETPWGTVRPRPRLFSFVPEAANRLGFSADPGSPGWARIALCVALVMVPLVIFLQQFTLGLRDMRLVSAPAAIRNSEPIDDPGVSELAIAAKVQVKLSHLFTRAAAASPQAGSSDEADQDEEDPTDLDSLDELAVTRTDRLRVAAVAGELLGKAAAIDRLDRLAEEIGPQSALSQDVQWFHAIYQKGASVLTPEARQSLIARHGWFGALAASFGAPDSDPLRHGTVSGGERIAGFFLAYGLGAVLAILAALIVAAGLITWAVKGRIVAMFDAPNPGGSVYLETFALFASLFALLLLLTLIMFNVGAEGTTGAMLFLEVVTWLLALVMFWPVIRGVQVRRVLEELGWTRGEGVLKEIGMGVLGYLAGITVTIVGIFINGFIDGLSNSDAGAEGAGDGGYPLFEPPPGNGWYVYVLMVASLMLWAPIVEETIFRGALYRHIRSRTRVVWAVLISSALFGLIHPYSTGGLAAVALSGCVFGLLREWRGSLIAPAVAHSLHNGTIALVTVGLVAAAG